MKKISFRQLWEKLLGGIRRFPLSVFFFAILSIFLVMNVHHKGPILSENFTFFWIYYSATAAFLSIALVLWCEEQVSGIGKTAAQAIGHFLWLAVCILLASGYNESLPFGLEAFSLAFLIFVSVFLVSFTKVKYDIQLWNFGTRTVEYAIISAIIGGILTGGIDLLFMSLDKLFNVRVPSHSYIYSAIAMMCFVAPILFMQLIPDGDDKHCNTTDRPGRFGAGVIHYLFIPLLAAYLVTLYAYGAHIIYSWQLPDGWISWLVSISMLCMVMIMILVYPLQFNDGNRFDKKIIKILPLLMLPLLVLMTVAICRRLSDYGITIFRLYLLTFNIWCYAVCLVLAMNRKKRFWWIPASFAVIFCLTSIGPWSFGNVTKSVLRKSVRMSVSKPEIAKALGGARISYARKDSAEVSDVMDKVKYLEANYDSTVVCDLADPAILENIRSHSNVKSLENKYKGSELCGKAVMAVPKDYGRMINVSEEFSNLKKGDLQNDSLPLVVHYGDSSVRMIFPIGEMRKRGNAASHGDVIVISGERALLYLDNYYLTVSDDGNLSISGILFLK